MFMLMGLADHFFAPEGEEKETKPSHPVLFPEGRNSRIECDVAHRKPSAFALEDPFEANFKGVAGSDYKTERTVFQ